MCSALSSSKSTTEITAFLLPPLPLKGNVFLEVTLQRRLLSCSLRSHPLPPAPPSTLPIWIAKRWSDQWNSSTTNLKDPVQNQVANSEPVLAVPNISSIKLELIYRQTVPVERSKLWITSSMIVLSTNPNKVLLVFESSMMRPSVG